MRKGNIIISVLLVLVSISCSKDRGVTGNGGSAKKEVEISISTSGHGNTRAPVKDYGHDNENIIRELDVLVFGEDGNYKYMRNAFKLNTGTNDYRVVLEETPDMLTLHLFANCRQMIEEWVRLERGGTWAQVQKQLIDRQPVRLVNSGTFTPLPMWGYTQGRLSNTSAPTKWGRVEMLRSVASADVYVEKNDKTKDFELTEMYVYYAPDMGYLAPGLSGTDYDLTPPATMKTSLTDEIKLTKVEHMAIMNTRNIQVDAMAIAYQAYFYDNDAVVNAAGADRRPSRVIIGGYYKQQAPEPGEPDTRTKSYYPIDFVESNGDYRRLKRNWKYEFQIFAVNGSGYGNPEEAAKGANTELNMEVKEWDKDQVLGVDGNYYVSMERKTMLLSRDAGSYDRIRLSYWIHDNMDDKAFTISFKDNTNGEEVVLGDGSGIKNDYFEVKFDQTVNDPASGFGDLKVTALSSYNIDHSSDTLVIKFRRLRFEVAVIQSDRDKSDWDDGGDLPVDL